MPQIHAPEIAQAIRRRYGVRGVQGFDTIAPEIIPVTIVDQLDREGAAQCGGSREQAAVAAQSAGVVITVPIGTLAYIRGVWVSSSTAGLLFISHPGDLVVGANGGEEMFLDRRVRGLPACQIEGLNTAAFGTRAVLKQIRVLAGESVYIPLGVYLQQQVGQQFAGSHQLLVEHTTVNTNLAASFEWEERSLVPNVP